MKTHKIDTASIKRELDGALLGPGEDGWDEGRSVYNLRVDQKPAAIGIPHSVADVSALIKFAAANGLRVLVQRTGHESGSFDSLDDTLLIRTSAMGGATFDPERQMATVGAGALWDDLVPATSKSGLIALHGSDSGIGVIGYSLAGGLGWYARKHGLACNRVKSLEIVDATGEPRHVDATSFPDLFWALRGGGGNFGVVTSLEFELLAVADVFAGSAFFPIERTGEVFEAWLDWTDSATDEISSSARVVRFPPAPALPSHLRGKAFALVQLVALCDEPTARASIEPLLQLGPAIQTFGMTSPLTVPQLHMDPADPIPFLGDGVLIDDVEPEVIETVVDLIGPNSDSTLISFEFRHLGGALSHSSPSHGALATIPGRFLEYGAGLAADRAEHAVTARKLEEIRVALEPVKSGHYLCFAESAVAPSTAFASETFGRLMAVKERHDPEGMFRASHPLAGG
jgi:hypothetical protein